MEKRIVGFCGIVCSKCRAYVATQKNDLELKKEVARSWSTEQEQLRPEDISCRGCLASPESLLKFCHTCAVRACGYQRNIKNCAYCDEFPCVKLSGLWKAMGSDKEKQTLEEIRRGLRT